ncbi:hypothetical protein K1T71_011324 [Dendrolimus kikuchii]|uniref:Uncharacterized protein n=1 Tax=Dendrolimus kikuchii TaxID=765133 RepID=A0ACC1CNG6_9NEOP|nr:hypothetical protein K1T71_011324 [Dendrolimus kikuchii]
MESLSNTPVLEFPPNTLKIVRKVFGLDKPGEMAEAVSILDQWVKKQEHFLKKDFSKEYLERTIILGKGSIETAKKRLDKLCTMKTLVPKFFSYSNIREELPDLLNCSWGTLLPKLTSDFHRVLLIRMRNTDFTLSQSGQMFYLCIILLEYIKAHDYCAGFILVFDCRHINVMDLISKVDMIELQRFLPILVGGYGTVIKGLVWITESKMIHGFISVLKTMLSSKMGSRIYVFSDLESLHNYLPKDILPLDFGGTEKTTEQLYDNIINVLTSKEHVEYVKEMQKAKTDEKMRIGNGFNEEYLGMPGTFRNLHVD